MASAAEVGLPLFLLVWFGFGAFVLYQYLWPMRLHRRGERLKGLLPAGRLQRGLVFEVLGALNVSYSICSLCVAILRPPRAAPHSDEGANWVANLVTICQVALMWWRTPVLSDVAFALIVAFGCFLFVHRVVIFATHGVQVQPFEEGFSFTGQVPWAARIFGGGWHRASCDDVVTKAVIRSRGVQLLLDVFLMSSVRFLASTGACADWDISGNGGYWHIPFDPHIHCQSAVQFVLLFLAAVALLGWYVWVFLLMMRMQNHYAQSAFGRAHYPADAYNPFFLLALLQARILLGILSAMLPHPMWILPACFGACTLLLGLMLWQGAPCRFQLVNWVYGVGLTICWTLSLVELIVATNRSSDAEVAEGPAAVAAGITMGAYRFVASAFDARLGA